MTNVEGKVLWLAKFWAPTITRSSSLKSVRVAFQGRKDSAELSKAFEMRKLSWITSVGPKYNHKCLQKRDLGDTTTEHTESEMTRRQREGWRRKGLSQEMYETSRI